MGRGIRGSAVAGDALAADGLQFTAGSAKLHRGQRRTNGQCGGTVLSLLQPSVRPSVRAHGAPARDTAEGVSLREETPLKTVIC